MVAIVSGYCIVCFKRDSQDSSWRKVMRATGVDQGLNIFYRDLLSWLISVLNSLISPNRISADRSSCFRILFFWRHSQRFVISQQWKLLREIFRLCNDLFTAVNYTGYQRVVGKGRYAQTQTQAILKYTFALITQFIFILTAVYKAVFASKPGR